MRAHSYRRVLTSSVVILILGLLVNLSGLLKEVFVAQRFGTGNQVDIFSMGLTIPMFFIGLSGAAMSSVIIPAYIRSKSQEREHTFVPDVIILSVVLSLLLMAVSVLAIWIITPYIASGFDGNKLTKSIVMGISLAPLILVVNLSVFYDGVLNSENSAYYNNIIALLIPFGTLVLLFGIPSESGMILCGGLYLGYGAKLIFQLIRFRLIKTTVYQWEFNKVMLQRNQALIHEFGWIIFSSIILGVLPIIAQSYAASLQSGVVASLNYANKLISVGLVVLSNVVTVVFLPFISREIVKNQSLGVQMGTRLTWIVLIGSFVLMIPVYFLLYPVVSLLLERGKFDHHSTASVVEILRYMIWYVPFYLAGTLLARLVVALNRSSVFIMGNIISLVLFTLVGRFAVAHWGVGGIGIALTVVYTVSCFYLLFRVGQKKEVTV